jgi:[acyl-carrier-protein] S-malonyltransferase
MDYESTIFLNRIPWAGYAFRFQISNRLSSFLKSVLTTMKTALVFPGQGAQTPGMGKELFEQGGKAKELFERANDILGFRLTDIMFEGSAEDLTETRYAQPSIFVHSVAVALQNGHMPDAVAGHSLGEFSALVVSGVLSFDSGLRLVQERALAMQLACETEPGGMAAVLGLEDHVVEEVCRGISALVVVPANYNCPGQLVISGSHAGIEEACIRLKEAGARRALPLKVGGAFHSPLMEPARQRLEAAIRATDFAAPRCPVYQNVVACAVTNTEKIRSNLIAQLTGPVRWTQSIQAMATDGIQRFVEAGPGNVLQGLIRKIVPEVETAAG